VLSRTDILRAVWRYEHDPATNIVDVYIGYLRRKLQRPGSPAPIFTVRSVGYRMGSVGEGDDRRERESRALAIQARD
jgi:DNA-binding response OmpR family regulator